MLPMYLSVGASSRHPNGCHPGMVRLSGGTDLYTPLMSSLTCLVPVARTIVALRPQDEMMPTLSSHPMACADDERNVRSG